MSAVISVKISGLVLSLLFIFLFWEDYKKNPSKISGPFIKKSLLKVGVSLMGLTIIFISVFYLHCALGKNIVNNNYYGASERYKEIISEGKTGDIKCFPLMFKEHVFFMMNDLKGVPPPNFDNPNEPASRPLFWPVGGGGIQYYKTRDKELEKNLYLQGNPLIWFTGLISLILSLLVVGGTLIFRKPVINQRLFRLIIYFTILYISYMGVMLTLKRSMYLHSYLIPLLFILILPYLIFTYIFEKKLMKNRKVIYAVIGIFFIAVIITYLYYSPLTYYTPLPLEEVEKRIWFNLF